MSPPVQWRSRMTTDVFLCWVMVGFAGFSCYSVEKGGFILVNAHKSLLGEHLPTCWWVGGWPPQERYRPESWSLQVPANSELRNDKLPIRSSVLLHAHTVGRCPFACPTTVPPVMGFEETYVLVLSFILRIAPLLLSPSS